MIRSIKRLCNILAFVLLIATAHAQSTGNPMAESSGTQSKYLIINVNEPILPGMACLSNNCKTLRGVIQCLNTGSFQSYVSDARFFHKNEKTNTNILRVSSSVVKVRKASLKNGTSTDTVIFEPMKIQRIITVVNPLAYNAFLQTARQNPNCLNTFCQNNCLTLPIIDSKLVANQARAFSNAIVPFTIEGIKFTPYQFRQMDDNQKKSLALHYLIIARNNMNTAICLGEDSRSILTRMLCTQCAQTLKDSSQLNTTCASFDPSTQVGYAQQPQDANATYQAQLAAILAQQKTVLEQILKSIPSFDATAAGANINISEIIRNLNSFYEKAPTMISDGTKAYNSAVSMHSTASDVYNTNRNNLNNYANNTYNTQTTNLNNTAANAYNGNIISVQS